MANTITRQTIFDGQRKLIVKVHIVGDGSGEETNTSAVDASTFSPAFTDERLVSVTSSLDGFAVHLHWDATANVDIIALDEGESVMDFDVYGGGLTNNAGSGKTGDILFSTNGLASGEEGTFILELIKQ